jgi:RNA polymerase sigma-70 factor (ECF subfamily)
MTSASTPKLAPFHDVFATTHWTVVLTAGQRAAPEATAALEELCRTYWYPLYVYVRKQTANPEDAQDLTQAFFERFLEKNYLANISSDKGRFRAFLLASLKHFLANEWDKSRRQKRGGGAANLPLDWTRADTQYSHEPADNLSPDKLYDRAWAITLLGQVITRLRDEAVADGKTTLFEELKPFLTVEKARVPYSDAAAKLGVAEGAVRVAVHRLRRRYKQLLREQIQQTLSDPAQVDAEIQALFSAFGS